jgi:hypothetical protein
MAPDEQREAGTTAEPWQQHLLDSIWLLAGAAVLFWALSYVVWGLVDLLSIGG